MSTHARTTMYNCCSPSGCRPFPHLAAAIDVGVENTQDVLELGRDNERLPIFPTAEPGITRHRIHATVVGWGRTGKEGKHTQTPRAGRQGKERDGKEADTPKATRRERSGPIESMEYKTVLRTTAVASIPNAGLQTG